MHMHKALVPLLALGILSGCGGSGSKNSNTPAPATVNVYMGSDNIPGFTSVVVSIAKLEWSPDGSSFYPVGTPVPAAYDLVGLQNGNGQTTAGQIVHGAVIAPTTVTQWRITWDTTSNPSDPTLSYASVVDASGNKGALTMPVTTVVPGLVNLASGKAYNVQIMVTGAGAVQNTGSVTSTTSKIPIFTFANATGAAYDLATTCTITGNLNNTVGSTALPMAYVEVYAETVVNSLPTIVRRSMTDASGHYVLDGLPASASSTPPVYYVVSQGYSPLNAVSYPAQASEPVSASTPTTFLENLPFPATAATTNTINVTVLPASKVTQSTWAEISHGLPTPAGQSTNVAYLIVRSANAATTLGVSDLVAFPGLPTPVTYTVTAQRTTTPSPLVLPIAPVPMVNPSFLLTAGTPTAVSFTYK